MSKLIFGRDSVVPVKLPTKNLTAGRGIDPSYLAQGTIHTDERVMYNSASNLNSSIIVSGLQGVENGNRQVAMGRYAWIRGDAATVIGGQARAGYYSTAIGASALAYKSTDNNLSAVAIGAESVATTQGAISIGRSANASNSSPQEGCIAIGMNTTTGNARGSIVIGHNSSACNNNTEFSSVIIGNDYNGNKTLSLGSVVIGGVGRNQSLINNRPTTGRYGVAVGFEAGCTNTRKCDGIVAVGGHAETGSSYTVSVGHGAQALNTADVAIGSGSIVDNSTAIDTSSSIGVGTQIRVYGDKQVGLGSFLLTYGTGNVCIGNQAQIGQYDETQTNSVAIGNNAQVYASNAIQLGTGTNGEAGTLQVGSMKVLNYTDGNGYIYPGILSKYTPMNGQILSYDANNDELKWIDPASGGSGGGSYTLPVASSSILGGVKIGNGLNITAEGVLSVPQYTNTTKWGEIAGKLNDQTDLKTALDNKQNIIQYTTMPTASSTLNGTVAQYIGETDTLYSQGNFYICEENDYPTANCTSDTRWTNLEVDAWTFANFIAKYFYNDELTTIPSKLYEIEYVDQFNGNGWILYENETSVYVKDVYKMGITAEGAEPALGDKIYVQLIMHDTTNWVWRKLLVDAQVSVNNTLTSTSTKQALSANMGRVLNDKVAELSGISHFLAMWDADTGTARYLDPGYQYASGDYYIIAQTMTNPLSAEANVTGYTFEYLNEGIWESIYGTSDITVTFQWVPSGEHAGWYDPVNDIVAQEPSTELGIKFFNTARDSELGNVGDEITVNYKRVVNYQPAGEMYQGDVPASRIETEDPVQISDMYFYDGAHWVFLPSSSRQIAVDEDLDSSSRNPVENRVVTEALEGKVSTSNTPQVIYATDENGDQQVYSLGAGLDFDYANMEIINTKESGEWGKITGNVEEQTDLVNYISAHSGGSGIQLIDVFAKDSQSHERNGSVNPYTYKGDYCKLYTRMNLDYNALKSSKNDIYITISRLNNTNKARNRRKMRVMDDNNRFKTNKKFYCWRIEDNRGHYCYDNGEWGWYTDYSICDTDYIYVYVENDYATVSDLINADPQVWISAASNDEQIKPKEEWYKNYGNWGTNFNELETNGLYISDYDIQPSSLVRCERYDIDTVVSLNSNFRGSGRSSEYEFGNVVKNEFIKMNGRVYNTSDGKKVYLWCIDWTSSNVDVFGYFDENEQLIANEIPDFMGDLQTFFTTDEVFNNYTLIETRPDLNWYYSDRTQSSFRDTVEHLRLSTQDFPDLEGYVSGWSTNWNSYWLDYPVKPIRLADCKIYLYKMPYCNGDDQMTSRVAQKLSRSYTFKEIEEDADLQFILNNQNDTIIELPYDTSYLWLRILGWQKWAYYRRGSEDRDVYAEPFERHNLKDAIKKCSSDQISNIGRLFGGKPLTSFNGSNIYYYRLQFNSIYGKDLGQSKVSMNMPISRKIYINGMCDQGLTEQI